MIGLALGMNVAIGLVGYAGAWSAALVAALFVLAAGVVWHAVPMWAASCRERKDASMEDRRQSLESRIGQALTELRVILPGAQALFGFQLSAMLTDRFTQLSTASTAVHVASLGFVASPSCC